jgi:hypothetical protein
MCCNELFLDQKKRETTRLQWRKCVICGASVATDDVQYSAGAWTAVGTGLQG